MSQPLHDTLKGKGRLVSGDKPPTEYQVEYEFHILTRIVERPGLPRVASQRSSTGVVRSTDGKAIPEGYYRLYAEDGEVLRVKNLGTTWAILAS